MTTTQHTIRNGAANVELYEYRLREVLIAGLVELASDPNQLLELFERRDTTRQGNAEPWSDRLVLLAKGLVSSQNMIKVGVGYPMAQAVLPYWSIVIERAGEDSSGAVGGAVWDVRYQLKEDPAQTLVRTQTLSHEYAVTLQLGIWAVNPEAATAMTMILRYLLSRYRGRLSPEMREIEVSESGFEPNTELFPDTRFVPVVRFSFRVSLSHTIKTEPVPNRITNTIRYS